MQLELFNFHCSIWFFGGDPEPLTALRHYTPSFQSRQLPRFEFGRFCGCCSTRLVEVKQVSVIAKSEGVRHRAAQMISPLFLQSLRRHPHWPPRGLMGRSRSAAGRAGGRAMGEASAAAAPEWEMSWQSVDSPTPTWPSECGGRTSHRRRAAVLPSFLSSLPSFLPSYLLPREVVGCENPVSSPACSPSRRRSHPRSSS